MRAVAVMAALAALGAAAPAEAATRSFHTPSGNIACLYRSTGGPGPLLRCDVRSLNDMAFRLDRTRKARRVRVTDAVPSGRVLRYGRSRRLGPFTCASRRSGLTCRSRSSGHGFFLSRARQRVF